MATGDYHMRNSVPRAFLAGLAIVAVSQAICYALESADHVNEGAQLLLVLLGPFAGSVSIAVLAPRFKFRMGVLLAIPASLLMGLVASFTVRNEFHGINRVIFLALMDFPFVLFFSALGTLLGCIVSYKTAKKRRN